LCDSLTKANTASKFLDVLKDFYAKSETKFEVVEKKIEELGCVIERLKNSGWGLNF
jgi:hypothetical protein